MQKLLILLMFILASCAILEGPPLESTIEKDRELGRVNRYDLRSGIKFNHKLHSVDIGFPCIRCHDKENPNGGKIKDFGFHFALTHCVGCHKNTKHAPTACDSCHAMRKLPKGVNVPE